MMTIVGVIEPIRLRGLVEAEATRQTGTYYFPFKQSVSRTLGVAVRTAQDPDSIQSAVRREIAQIDPELPFYGVRHMEDRLATSLMDRRTPMLLATGFAAVALFLAAIGIYGVLAYQVSQRRREIGIRMALGARSQNVLSLVVRQGMTLVMGGVALGLIAAFAVTRLIGSLLFGVGAADSTTFVAASLLLVGVAALAGYLPARRATKVDPLIALRHD
jgi:putative ABC transport system permease protein